jgi:hypothetical protein
MRVRRRPLRRPRDREVREVLLTPLAADYFREVEALGIERCRAYWEVHRDHLLADYLAQGYGPYEPPYPLGHYVFEPDAVEWHPAATAVEDP